MEEKYKSQEEMEKKVNSVQEIDPSKIITFVDYIHDESWRVEKRWFDKDWNQKRETVWHSPHKQSAIDYAKKLNKDKKTILEGGQYMVGEHWYEITFGYPFYDEILRGGWKKEGITKEIPFDAKIRIIIYE